nr:ATPase, F1/V1/A1 complex, alpha/beta subunit, zinc knuckle CX2CX4HX4C [Tanacetum cinerariifolium]
MVLGGVMGWDLEPAKLPLCIKLHNVPIEAWTVKGVSAIASSLGTPLIMDKTTARMCHEGAGRVGYAKVLVEVKAESQFKEKVEINYTCTEINDTCTKFVNVEYTWKPAKPREKIPRAFAWKMILPFSWARCRTLFVSDNLSLPLETLTPTKSESESDWWKTSLEYFEGKDVQSEAVSEQLEIEKDALSEEVHKKKKRKRGSSPPSFQNPTYDRLMTIVSTLEGTVTTLTQIVSSLQGSIGTLESRLLALEGDARISTLTQTMSSLQGTIDNLESRFLTFEGDERDFKVVSDGDIPAYMSPGPQRCDQRCGQRYHIGTHDDYRAAQDTFCTEDELQFIGMEKGEKPNYDLPNLSKIKRNKYPIYSTFEKKKTDCYFDCLPKGRTCEPSFWDILYPGGKKVGYLDERKLDGLHINAFIELMMRKRPRNAQWTLGLSELVAFHIESLICKDCTKIVKKQSKPGKIEHEIIKNASKARSKDIFC